MERRGRLAQVLGARPETALQAGEDARVELADAALREVEHEADLAHGELLEVIEDDDEPLLERELARHHLHDVLALELVDRALGAAILEEVDRVERGRVVLLL